MDPRLPQGTLEQIADNPLVASAIGRTVDQNGEAMPSVSGTEIPVQSPTGSPVPTPGASPYSPVSGGASLAQTLLAKGQNLLSTFRSQHVEKIGDNATKALAAQPDAATKPGGWSRALVGGALDALKGVSAVAESLGDVAAVGTIPAGAGGLTGAARTLQARQQRMRQQRLDVEESKKNNALIAEANARTRHTQALAHQLDEETKDKLIASNQPVLDVLKEAGAEYVLQEKKDSDDLTQDIQNGKISPAQHAGVMDGKKDLGNGLSRGTYSIVVPHDVDLDPSKPRHKQVLDLLNEYAPPGEGKIWQGETKGVVHLGGDQFLHLVSQATAAETSTMARDKYIVDKGLASVDNVKKLESIKFEQNLDGWNQALADTGGDIIGARNLLLRTQPNKWKDLDNDLSRHMGKELYDKALEDHQKRLDIVSTQFEDRRKELTTADGPKAAGLAEQWRTEMTNVPSEYRPTLQRLISEADAKAKGVADYQTNLKARESEAEQKAGEGDISAVEDMALNYEYDPDKLFSRFKGQKQKVEFLADIHRKDPNWSEAEYRARYNTVNDYRPSGEGGKAKRSLNAFAGHTGRVNDLINSLQNTRSPLLNTPLNKFKEEVFGSPQFVAYRQDLQAAADEYLNFLLNNHAKHESDDKLVTQMTSSDTSPAKSQAILREMAHTVAIRARAQNDAYHETMKKDIPGFVNPDTELVLRTFGVDPKSITATGTSGLVGGPRVRPGWENLPAPVKGMTRVQLPSGKPMDFQADSDALRTAIAHGAIVASQEQ
jgi:hypothetical protein